MRYDHTLTKLNYIPSICIHHYIFITIIIYNNHIIFIIYMFITTTLSVYSSTLSLSFSLSRIHYAHILPFSPSLLGQHLYDPFLLLEVEPVRELTLVCVCKYALLRGR